MTPLNTLDILNVTRKLIFEFPKMMRRQWWTQEKITTYQLEKLKRRLTDAKNKVRLYQDFNLVDPQEILSLADWQKIPILTKNDLLKYPCEYSLNSDYSLNNLILSRSSGSTGKALSIYYDHESYYLFIVATLRLYNMVFRYLPWHKQTYIYSCPYPISSLFGAYPLNFISTLTPIPQIIQELKKNPPDIITCYPSHLLAISEMMTKDDFKAIRPKVINVNSEISTVREREYLSQKFGALVFDDYSSEELTRIASQCAEKNYHILDDINYLEIVDDNNKLVPEGIVGNIIGTNLHNAAMPLLRYAQGDRAAIRTSICQCGRKFRVLEKLEGRKNDAFILPDGKQISSGFLLDLTYEIILNYENAIRAFCLIQEQPDLWILELAPGHGWNSGLSEKIAIKFKHNLNQPSVKLQLKIVNEVTRTATGKINPIVSRVKR